MIKQETIIINGRELVKTYSDNNKYIIQNETGVESIYDVQEEKELSTFFIEDIKTQIESINVQKEIVDNYCNRVLKKYFTRKQLEKIDEVIKSIKEGERI